MIANFVVFILTHGRADNVKTAETLKKCNYKGPVVYVVDDEDAQLPKYIENFGEENVEIFNKDEIAKRFDRGDNFGKKGAIIFARNVCFEIARKRGYKYFIELDDDYTSFSFKFNDKLDFVATPIKDIEVIWSEMLEYYKKTTSLTTIAMAQGGDFIGGGSGTLGKCIPKRKAMNSFICSTDRPFDFVGTINEDVNTYTSEGRRGKIFLTCPIVALNQVTTQKNKGGMTELYLDSGTYIKSFYSVMYTPSAVKVAVMGGNTEKRLHHSVAWNNCTPKIIPEKFKK